MLAEMTWGQFREWMEFYAISPFGDYRADLRSGFITAAIYNVNRDTDKHPKPYLPTDFMPYHDQDGKAKSNTDRKPLKEGWGRVTNLFKSFFGAPAAPIGDDK